MSEAEAKETGEGEQPNEPVGEPARAADRQRESSGGPTTTGESEEEIEES